MSSVKRDCLTKRSKETTCFFPGTVIWPKSDSEISWETTWKCDLFPWTPSIWYIFSVLVSQSPRENPPILHIPYKIAMRLHPLGVPTPALLYAGGVARQGFPPYTAALQLGLDSPLIRWKISFSKPIDTKLAASDRNIWCNRRPSWIRTSFPRIETWSCAGTI